MKKIISLLLVLVMMLGLVACGAAQAPATEAPATEATATEAPATEAPTEEATAAPVSRCLTSGSFPTLPIRITLLNDISLKFLAVKITILSLYMGKKIPKVIHIFPLPCT